MPIYVVFLRLEVVVPDSVLVLEFHPTDREIQVVLHLFVSDLLQNQTHGNKQAFLRNGLHHLTLKTYFLLAMDVVLEKTLLQILGHSWNFIARPVRLNLVLKYIL